MQGTLQFVLRVGFEGDTLVGVHLAYRDERLRTEHVQRQRHSLSDSQGRHVSLYKPHVLVLWGLGCLLAP